MLIDMPLSRFGASGAMVNGVWHLATQRHILRRHAADPRKVTVLWIDEFQNHLNSFDSAISGRVPLARRLHGYPDAVAAFVLLPP